MLEPEGIDTVRLRTARIADMLRFYRDALGCALERGDSGALRLRAGTGTVELVLGYGPGMRSAVRAVVTVHFRDLEPGAAHRWLDAFGYGPATADGNGVHLEDPDGNRIHLRLRSTAYP